jgi:hypothetical protein
MANFGNNIKVNKNQLLDAVLEQRSTDTSAPTSGLIIYRTDTNKVRVYSNSTWRNLAWEDEIATANAFAFKDSVAVASTAPLTLASWFAAWQVIDGYTLILWDRILIKDQATGSENGIYIVTAWAPTRATDASNAVWLTSAIVSVEQGTANADSAWLQTADNIVLGTTALTFVAFGSSTPDATTAIKGKVALATLAETEAKTVSTKAVVPSDLTNFARIFDATVWDGSALTYTVTHNLWTFITKVEVYKDSWTRETEYIDVTRPTINTVLVAFSTAPATNAYRVVVTWR